MYRPGETLMQSKKVLSEDFITQGPKITEFEEEIANYVGAKYGVAF